MTCPWCSYHPSKNDKPFKHIKTNKYKSKVVRGWKCPDCGWSFISEEIPIKQTFYKKEYPIQLDAGN